MLSKHKGRLERNPPAKPDSVRTRLAVAMMAAVASEGAVGHFGAPEEACVHSPPLLPWA